jgi:hypothetical protein
VASPTGELAPGPEWRGPAARQTTSAPTTPCPPAGTRCSPAPTPARARPRPPLPLCRPHPHRGRQLGHVPADQHHAPGPAQQPADLGQSGGLLPRPARHRQRSLRHRRLLRPRRYRHQRLRHHPGQRPRHVPARCWKVVVILPTGADDATRVSTSTRVIAIDTPNETASAQIGAATAPASTPSNQLRATTFSPPCPPPSSKPSRPVLITAQPVELYLE